MPRIGERRHRRDHALAAAVARLGWRSSRAGAAAARARRAGRDRRRPARARGGGGRRAGRLPMRRRPSNGLRVQLTRSWLNGKTTRIFRPTPPLSPCRDTTTHDPPLMGGGPGTVGGRSRVTPAAGPPARARRGAAGRKVAGDRRPARRTAPVAFPAPRGPGRDGPPAGRLDARGRGPFPARQGGRRTPPGTGRRSATRAVPGAGEGRGHRAPDGPAR